MNECKKKNNKIKDDKETKKLEDSLFLDGKKYYIDSLNCDLDQRLVRIAINKLFIFVKKYPKSKNKKQAYKFLHELLSKIEKKDYHISDFYYTMGKYESAIFCFQEFLKKFPRSKFKENVLYKICVSEYNLGRERDFYDFYQKYMKYFSNFPNAKKLKILCKKLIKIDIY